MPASASSYRPDVLGPDFEQLTIAQPTDYEGAVCCTLVRHQAAGPLPDRAVLYVHGFSDYFFQRELAEQWAAHGYRFYALDLRKYGRSLLPHQRPNNVRNLHEYFPDLDAALATIQREGHQTVVLNAHSTGGLIGALYAEVGARRDALAALVLNSPFFAMNQPWLLRHIGVPVVAALGRALPNVFLPGKLPESYGQSLHRNFQGEWEYHLPWKPIEVFPITMGWLRAIAAGHRAVARGLHVAQPVLVLHSARTVRRYHPLNDEFFEADAVLNVEHIRTLAPRLGPHVTVCAIEGGMHDLVLSRPAVRAEVYRQMFQWLGKVLPATTALQND
ncbi:alpha/beta hydrolase [Hymenobacter busanensis]|uniref:Alpha/beta hydrolase n=1 Tax=Hymenobacter busanensis TaxID=2607656 RepID=A0A7L5A1T0_9BACT|nr:alpha/beta hydrolase [Hymenobacter busanensis]KAA9338338.1 alpha/beta hydrolase [Hymenobacter busanensis]QHJ09237.1 alpha/beta fold hydrolase [Hymenobacter busanensis]